MTQTYLIIILILSALSIMSGLLLTFRPKPYDSLVSSLHKLDSVAAFVVLVIALWQKIHCIAIGSPVFFMAVLAAVLFVLSLASGAVIVAKPSGQRAWLLVHRVAPLLTIIACALSALMMMGKWGL
jgi:hypothetical protein